MDKELLKSIKELSKSINKKLEVIIALLLQLRLQTLEKPLLRDQIKALVDLSLEPKEIAGILSRSNNFINKELSQIRKKGVKKRHDKKNPKE